MGIEQANRDHDSQTGYNLSAFSGQRAKHGMLFSSTERRVLSHRDNRHPLSTGIVHSTELRALYAMSHHSGSSCLRDEADIFIPRLCLRHVEQPIRADTASGWQTWGWSPG